MTYPGSWKYLLLSEFGYLLSTFRAGNDSPLESWTLGVGVASEDAKSDAVAIATAHLDNRMTNVGILRYPRVDVLSRRCLDGRLPRTSTAYHKDYTGLKLKVLDVES